MADVLIVDDDANNRLLLAILLEHAGHTFFEASDAASALTIAGDKRPALIVVDLSLPGVSGVALIKQLRGDPPLGDPKIAVYTATRLENAATQELADLYRVCAVIPKPGDPREILKIFEGLLA